MSEGTESEGTDLFELDQLVRAYLHQDMELEAATVPEAIGRYARINDERTKAGLQSAMERFLHRFDNDLHGEFERRYGYDFMPDELGMTVPEFFDMVGIILADPGSYQRFETAGKAPVR